MPDATSLIMFMTATLALNLSPGPDMLYVIARSVGQGQKAGVISALGGTFLVAGTLTLAGGFAEDALTMALTFGLIHLGYGTALTLLPAGTTRLPAASPEVRQ